MVGAEIKSTTLLPPFPVLMLVYRWSCFVLTQL